MAVTDSGTVIAAWSTPVAGGSRDIVARQVQFTRDATVLGDVIPVSRIAGAVSTNAVVASFGNERFVVAWESRGNPQDREFGIFAKVFDGSGKPQTMAIRINSSTTGSQRDPAITWISATRFVVAWSGAGPSDENGVFARVFDASGKAVTNEIRVPQTRGGVQHHPVVISLPNGGFQVAWGGNGPGDPNGIFSRQFNSGGKALGVEFRVNTSTAAVEQLPVMAGNGNQVVIAWGATGNNQDKSGSGILARRFGLNGTAMGGEFRLSETTQGSQSDPSIAFLPDGGFVAAWQNVAADGPRSIYQREFLADGTPRFGERLVNTTTAGGRASPTVRAQGPDGYVIAWDGNVAGDSNGRGAGLQRYGDPFMPTITSDNKLVGDYHEVLYLDPSVPMKTFTITNSSNLTIYPILEDANASADTKDPTIGLYDPYDPLNQEYRGYVGYKDPTTGEFYLGLKPGATFTFQVPLVFWDAGRMHVTTDAHYLITATGADNPQPNPFKYYDVDPFSGNPQALEGSIQVTNNKPTDTLVLAGNVAAKLAKGLSVASDAGDLQDGTTVKDFELGQGGTTTIVHLSAVARSGGTTHPYTFYKPTARFMEDTSIDGSLGRIMWYHARAKGSGQAEQVGLDAPTQLTEFTIRDPFLGDTAFKTHESIATSEKISLVNYDVSYVDSMVLPVAMEATDAQLYPPQRYEGTIQLDNEQPTNRLTLKLNFDPKLLVKGMLVTSASGDLPHDTMVDSAEAGPNETTIVHLTKTGNPNAGQKSDYFFTHPQPTAAFGWIGASQTFAQMQAAIKQFTLGNKPNQNSNGLGLYFADDNNPDGNGYPEFYNPDVTLSGIKLPSGQNLPGQSPLKGNPGPASNYDSNRFIVTSGGDGPIKLSSGGSAGGQEETGPNELYPNFDPAMTRQQREAFRQQLEALKNVWVVTAKTAAHTFNLPKIKEVGPLDDNDRFKVTLVGPTNLASDGYTFDFTRAPSDYASTKLANLWYSWAKHYVDAVSKSHPNFVPIQKKDGVIEKDTNILTLQNSGDLTKPGLLAPGMVVTTNGSNFPVPTADDPITRVTILKLTYHQQSNSTIVELSKRPTGVGNADVEYTFSLPVMLTPKDPGVTTFELSFTKDAAETEMFAQSVYQLVEAMSTIKLLDHQGPDWLQVLTNCIGGNIGFIKDIGVVVDPRKGYIIKGYKGIADVIRDRIKSVLRGVSDFNAVPEASGKWYPDPSLKGDKTGQQINGNDAPYNVLNLDPFVWFVHEKLGLSGYGFSLDDDVADVGANGATKLSIDVGGFKGLPNKAEWTWGATYGPVTSKQGKIVTYQSGDSNNGLKKLTMLDTTPLPVGLQVHGGDPAVGPGALVYGPGIPLGTRVFLPIPFDNEVILDTRAPQDTPTLVGPFNFRGMLPTALASPVTGKSATLRVVGTEDLYGESSWTYTWSLVDGPSGVTATFAPNRTNGSKKTIVTLNSRTPGTYLFRVTMTAPDGSSIHSDVTVSVP